MISLPLVVLIFAGPAGLAAQAPAVEGKILAVEDRGTAVGLGRKDGIERGQEFDVFSRPEYVRLPGIEKGLYVVEKQIARLVVVEVQEDRSICRVSEGKGVEAGLRAVRCGLRAGPRAPSPPYIEERIELTPAAEVAGGERIRIRLRAGDLDEDLSHLEWSAGAGRLDHAVTPGFENAWLAPSKQGPCEITVTAVDRRGLKTRRPLTLASTGPARHAVLPALALEATLGAGARHFARAGDLEVDAEGQAWILDDSTRCLIQLGPDWAPRLVSDAHARDARLSRLARSGSSVYFLNEATRRILKYTPGAAMFSSAPEKEVAGSGARLRCDPAGRLWVADPASASVTVYSPAGVLLATLGRRDDAAASLFQEPVALDFASDGSAWILDRGRKALLRFRDFAPAGEKPVDVPQDEVIDFRIQPRSGSFLLLSPRQLYRLGEERPERFGSARPFEKAQSLAVDPAGRCFVVTGGGRAIERLTPEGTPDGVWGEEGFEGAAGCSVSESGDLALWKPGKVWWLDRDGWVRTRFDSAPGNPLEAGWIEACLWVLDRSTWIVSVRDLGGGERSFSLPEELRGAPGRIAARAAGLQVLSGAGDRIVELDAAGREARRSPLAPPAGPEARLASGPGAFLALFDGERLSVLGAEGEKKILPGPDLGKIVSAAGEDGDLFLLTDATGGVWLYSARLGRRTRVAPSQGEFDAVAACFDPYRRLCVLERSGRLLRFSMKR